MGLSRNKVAVPEGAAGSPPFYGVFQDAGLASVVWPMRREWFPVSCGRAGVEEIVGFAGPWGLAGSGADMLLGSRTATRIRFGCVRFSGCPWRDAVGLAGRGSGPVGARGGLRTG